LQECDPVSPAEPGTAVVLDALLGLGKRLFGLAGVLQGSTEALFETGVLCPNLLGQVVQDRVLRGLGFGLRERMRIFRGNHWSVLVVKG